MFKEAAKSHYETIAPLGRGGMGEVFLAAMPGPPGLNQLAVLKRIWPELAHEPEFVAMFLDEARLALRMRHQNIVQTFEVGREASRTTRPGAGSEPDRYYIAMEYLAGQTLAQVTTRLAGSNAFGIQLRLQVVVDILSALEYAHQLRSQDGTPLGVVHRDISPQNVFLTYGGEVKLMDFGVAKSLGASHQTRPGTFKGRFAYAAPEQIRGAKVDRRSDLFSVGIILWELLTEQHMFRGRSKVDIVRILTGRARLPSLPADWPIPERLRGVIARALALQPSARYQSAAAFRQELVDVQTNWLPADPRSLGKVVSCAFASEREGIEKLIEHHFDVNEDALTRVPIKPRKTLPQVSMPALWTPAGAAPPLMEPAAVGPLISSTPASAPARKAARMTPVTPIATPAAPPRPLERSIDRVPFLESAVASLMTWQSRFAPDTLMDASASQPRRLLWRRLRRSRLACAAAGLCFGALCVLVLVHGPAGDGGASAAPASLHAGAIAGGGAVHASGPMVELVASDAPAAAVPAAPMAAALAPVLPVVRASKAAAVIPTSGVPLPPRPRLPRPAHNDLAKVTVAAPGNDKNAGASTAADTAAVVPARIAPAPVARGARPTLDTENPWGP